MIIQKFPSSSSSTKIDAQNWKCWFCPNLFALRCLPLLYNFIFMIFTFNINEKILVHLQHLVLQTCKFLIYLSISYSINLVFKLCQANAPTAINFKILCRNVHRLMAKIPIYHQIISLFWCNCENSNSYTSVSSV